MAAYSSSGCFLETQIFLLPSKWIVKIHILHVWCGKCYSLYYLYKHRRNSSYFFNPALNNTIIFNRARLFLMFPFMLSYSFCHWVKIYFSLLHHFPNPYLQCTWILPHSPITFPFFWSLSFSNSDFLIHWTQTPWSITWAHFTHSCNYIVPTLCQLSAWKLRLLDQLYNLSFIRTVEQTPLDWSIRVSGWSHKLMISALYWPHNARHPGFYFFPYLSAQLSLLWLRYNSKMNSKMTRLLSHPQSSLCLFWSWKLFAW